MYVVNFEFPVFPDNNLNLLFLFIYNLSTYQEQDKLRRDWLAVDVSFQMRQANELIRSFCQAVHQQSQKKKTSIIFVAVMDVCLKLNDIHSCSKI